MTETAAAIDLNGALAGLLKKYAVEPPGEWRIVDGGEPSGTAGDGPIFAPGWSLTDSELPERTVPLLPWRHERRFIELKRLIDEETVAPLLMCRFACLTDGRRMPLSSILYREFDLLEWISGTPIAAVCASVAGREAGPSSANLVVRLADGTIGSVEAGTTLPRGTVCQDRHELIARRGVASDRAVDTQVGQSSIYAWTADGQRQHTDVDAELFGLEVEQAALVRSAFEAIGRPDLASTMQKRHRYLRRWVESAFESDRRGECLAVEGGV